MILPVKVKGFTLVELVTVMILLGILATVVLPKFSSRDGYAEYAVRDQFISAFRYAQQRAMYDHGGTCYRLNIDAAGFGPQRAGVAFGPVAPVNFAGDYQGISLSPQVPIYFDGLGNSYSANCSDIALIDPYIITFNPSGIQVQVYSTGFIQVI
ncbi:MAG: MSHA pilin protein MshC [Gammaproteobacteria bacterium]